jgi:hypothetical protein
VFTARYELYLCVLCGSQNKQLLFPYTSLTDTANVYYEVRTDSFILISGDISLEWLNRAAADDSR